MYVLASCYKTKVTVSVNFWAGPLGHFRPNAPQIMCPLTSCPILYSPWWKYPSSTRRLCSTAWRRCRSYHSLRSRIPTKQRLLITAVIKVSVQEFLPNKKYCSYQSLRSRISSKQKLLQLSKSLFKNSYQTKITAVIKVSVQEFLPNKNQCSYQSLPPRTLYQTKITVVIKVSVQEFLPNKDYFGYQNLCSRISTKLKDYFGYQSLR